ncbi:enoyl-CoA hydratase/isomerase family protein [Lutibaculum baratangense]|uniref:Enoyl-CoA hydratase n=1 Tax=Lutibaculum baratangense AMV1 TaxID=631454 RepID=V4RCA3_9HYPH|nr:enoyl-CoA hydratase/isomerase family protein [Lutibaculum baratangense]ESR23009.1 Enoyl-CoA hydratase [Lutibaculum baratangense AMV1]
MAGETTIAVTREGAIARIVLDRPGARNALDLPMCHDLARAFEQLDADPDIRVVVLGANGPVFCAGADLKERTGRDGTWVYQRRLAAFRAYETIERCRKPVFAVVQGPVVGSGGEIAMACDFIVASTEASFRFPEPQWGTVGATQRLQRVIGKSRAKELLFTGRTMPVEEAHALGLVARVVAPDELDALAEETAAAIAAAPPLAMALTKHCVDMGSTTDLASGIRIELAAIERNLAEGDWKSGIEEFNSSVGRKASAGE